MNELLTSTVRSQQFDSYLFCSRETSTVEQSHIITPFSHHLPTLLHLIKEDRDMHKGSSKQVVFFPTARHVDAAFHALSNINGLPTLTSMHSRLTQKARERSSDKFRAERSAILLCSDVAARGVDFPG